MHPYEKTGDGEEYGLGLDILQVHGKKVIGHSGGFNGFTSQILLDPSCEIGVVVLSNTLGSPACDVARGVLEGICDFADRASHYRQRRKMNPKLYEGIYRSVWCDTVVARFGDSLIGFDVRSDSPLKQNEIFILEKVRHQFVVKSKSTFAPGNEIAEFSAIKNGKAQKLVLGGTLSRRIY